MPNKKPSLASQANTWAGTQTFPASGIVLGEFRLNIIEEIVNDETRMVFQVTGSDGTVRELTSIRYA